ncbi:MAG TPA: TlpA family protein disulfide reductase [Gammaproteobacteria bacterium]|nr:TlpA family protein disulfide reductase [Gammaproteobacteria bacterium]
MKRSLQITLLVVVAALGLAAGLAWQAWRDQPATVPDATGTPGSDARSTITSLVVGKRRPDYQLPDLEGQARSAAAYDGKVVMVNFWATWCPPCVREMPALEELYETYRDRGLVVVGIALDNGEAVVDFVDPMGIEYPILIGEDDGIDISRDYGNRLGVLPYTVIIGRDGIIRHAHPGEIDLEQARAYVEPLL